MKKYFSLFVILALLAFMGFYLDKNISIIMETFNTTISHITGYFFVAAASVFVSYLFVAKSYQVVFKMNGMSRSIWNLYKLNITGLAVNVIIPTAGLSQAVIYAEDAHKRGDSKASTVNSVIVTYISDYTSIALFLIFSLLYLWTINSIVPHVVIPAVIFILLTISVYVFSYFAGRESRPLERFILWFAHILERLATFVLRREVDLAGPADKLYKNFKYVNKAILEDPKDWFVAIGYACLQHIFSITALYIIFISLGVTPLIRVLIAVYSVAEAIRVVSPTPSGIGFVEGSMYLAFTSLGIPGSVATTATIIYRGLIFWIPLAIGFVFYQRQKLKDALIHALK